MRAVPARRASKPVVLFLAFAAALAGCVAPPADAPGAAMEFVDPIIEQHDHSDPSQHALQTTTMALLWHDALGEKPGEARGTYGEIDIQGDFAYVAVLGDGGEVPGFIVLDITDRAAPKILSFTPSPGTRVADVKATTDNAFVFVAGEKGVTPSPTGAAGAATSGKGAEYATRNGIRVFDASDPAAPKQVEYAPSDSGCHMVYYKQYASGEWLFCVGTAVNIYKFSRSPPKMEIASRYQPQDVGGLAEAVRADPTNPTGALLFETTPHDITIQEDASGKVLMYASYWDLGIRIVDVSDPRSPKEVSSWRGEGAEKWAGNVHTAMAHQTADGRRLIYATPELFTGSDVPALFILDATDLAAPKLVGEWTAPGDHPNDGIRFSLHNFQIVNDQLYLAYYHAGVWVLDLRGEKAVAPGILGYYLPHEAVKTYEPPEEVDVPDTWDVVLKDGHIYATDIATGLYVLHYTADALGDPSLTSFA